MKKITESLAVRIVALILLGALLLGVAFGIVGIVVLWRVIPSGFLPNEDQGYVMVAVTTPAASSLQVTERSMARVNSMVCSHKEVESSAVVAGFNMLSGSAATNSGVIFVKLKPYSERTTSAEELAVILSEKRDIFSVKQITATRFTKREKNLKRL